MTITMELIFLFIFAMLGIGILSALNSQPTPAQKQRALDKDPHLSAIYTVDPVTGEFVRKDENHE